MIEFFRTATNPWGQDVLMGVAWDLLWLAAIAGAAFLVGHAVWHATLAPSDEYEGSPSPSAPVDPDAHVSRHGLGARLFHWVMAAAMLVLLVTAFFPVLGIQFPWVTIHWIAGVVLIAAVLWHIVQATFWQSLWNMWISADDVRDAVQRARRFLGQDVPAPRKPGKYPLENKLFHHVTTVAGLGVIVTGVFMMFRVDTVFWARNPYLFSDQAWGWIYVIHGLCAVGFVTMVMAHIYFAVRPEKLWLTRSMILGWITGREYGEHHDPERWTVEEADEPSIPDPGGAGRPGIEAAD